MSTRVPVHLWRRSSPCSKVAPGSARLFFVAQSRQIGIVAQDVPNEHERGVNFIGGILAIRPGKISFRFQIVPVLKCNLAGVREPLTLPGIDL